MTKAEAKSRRLPFVHTPWRGRALGFGLAGLVGLATLAAAPAWLKGTSRAVAAYDAAAVVLIFIFWTFAMHRHAPDTQSRAAVDDPGRNVVLAVVLLTVLTGLASAVVLLGQAPHVSTAAEKTTVYVLALIAVVAGWFVIHTTFTFRYAHLYYYDDDDDNEADRGLTFPGNEDPNDYDFAYFSFVVGMTFQVSDVQVTDPGVRRVVLMHGLISFGYNSMILALVVNILSSLLH